MTILKSKAEEKRFDKRVCSSCGATAKIWDKGKWHCKIASELGSMNLVGFCPKVKKKKGKK